MGHRLRKFKLCLPYIYSLGAVKVWDPRQKNDPVATMEPGEGETKRDCWAVAFGRTFFTYHPLYMCIALTDRYYCLSINIYV